MARGEDGRARRPGRFGTSGSTKHGHAAQHDAAPPPPHAAPPPAHPMPPPAHPVPPPIQPPPAYPPPSYGQAPYPPAPPPPVSAPPPYAYRPYPPDWYPPPSQTRYPESPTERYTGDPQQTHALPPGAAYPGSDTRPMGASPGAPGAPGAPGTKALPPSGPAPVPPVAGAAAAAASPTVTRVMMDRTRHLSGVLRKKVVDASEADGARESGLTALLWNQVMSLASDAMITVALAGTVFFAASGSEQRGNVLQYLLITMAPFAIVAPIIGPLLDRLQHGRRIAMGATGIGRAVLALVMAAHFNDMLVLLPCALGSLVLSKAYAVLRGSAAPRLVPPSMTLVTANARLSLFGLAATGIGGVALAAFLKVTGSYQWGLRLTAVAFAVTAFYSFKLPKSIDSPQGGPRPMPLSASTVPTTKLLSSARLREWSKRGFADEMLTTLQGQCAMRGIIGFLTLFLAFYIQDTSDGFDAVVDLAMFAVAAGGASFVGTAIGARLKLAKPEAIVYLCALVSAVACLITVVIFGTTMAIVCVAICGVGNALGKLSLDAVIQRDVEENLRSSAFARSETFLQLAWVLGAALAVILPAGHGQIDFLVATVVLGGVVAAITLRRHALKGHRAAGRPAPPAYDPGYGPPGTPYGTRPPTWGGPGSQR